MTKLERSNRVAICRCVAQYRYTLIIAILLTVGCESRDSANFVEKGMARNRHVTVRASLVDSRGLPLSAGRRVKMVLSVAGSVQEAVEVEADANSEVSFQVSSYDSVRLSGFTAESVDEAYHMVCSEYSGVQLGDIGSETVVRVQNLVLQDAVLLTRIEGSEWLNLRENWVYILPCGDRSRRRIPLLSSLPIDVYTDTGWQRDFVVSIERGEFTQESHEPVTRGSTVIIHDRPAWRVGGYAITPVADAPIGENDPIPGMVLNAWITGPNADYTVDITEAAGVQSEPRPKSSEVFFAGSIPGPGTYYLNVSGFCNPIRKRIVASSEITRLGELRLWEGWKPTIIKIVGPKIQDKIEIEVLVPQTTETWITVPFRDKTELCVTAPYAWSLSARVQIAGEYRYFGISSHSPVIVVR